MIYWTAGWLADLNQAPGANESIIELVIKRTNKHDVTMAVDIRLDDLDHSLSHSTFTIHHSPFTPVLVLVRQRCP